ncbi:hypothetical protein VNO78_13859 [Psophocarpus tetragonolobus]|uniref:Uncharacterized protein n=1 Tax=Psophocarpus tetragonolobus TaxID=3891 RepID=A0AAN9SY66_PSOTE
MDEYLVSSPPCARSTVLMEFVGITFYSDRLYCPVIRSFYAKKPNAQRSLPHSDLSCALYPVLLYCTPEQKAPKETGRNAKNTVICISLFCGKTRDQFVYELTLNRLNHY